MHLEGRHGRDLLHGLSAIAARDEDDRELTQLFTILAAEATSPDHPANAYFRDRYELILSTLQRAFEEAARAGQLRPGTDVSAAAQGYIALSDGMQLQRLYDVGSRTQLELINAYLDALLVDADSDGD